MVSIYEIIIIIVVIITILIIIIIIIVHLSEDTVIWGEDFVQAWDECDMNNRSNADQEEAVNRAAEVTENVGDSDVDSDTLPSNQEEYKKQQQDNTNKEILNFLNKVVENQKIIIQDHQRDREEQARFNQTVTTTLQKQWIVLKQIIAMQKRHDRGHEQTARDQEITVTLLNELLQLFK